MTRPAQSSFLDALTVKTETASTDSLTVEFFEFSGGPECTPGSLDDVPLGLRLPGEVGYQEWDRYGRVVKP